MNWLALGPAEAAALWTAAASLAVWLYLRHRRPVRRKVSTLRFWASLQPSARPQRRRVLREPWALIAQLVFLLCIILALANLRWGGAQEARNVVVVVDASAWSQARPGGASLLEQVRAEVGKFLNSLSADDQVLLLRAEADSAPIAALTRDRAALRRALADLQPSAALPDVPRALELGRAALAGAHRGVLAYIGPGMLDAQQARGVEAFRESLAASPSVQFLSRVVGPARMENRGVVRLAFRRDPSQPSRWRVMAQVKNYAGRPAVVALDLSLPGRPLQRHSLSLSPGELATAEDDVDVPNGGLVEAALAPADDLALDDRAAAFLPAFRPVRVAVIAGGAVAALRPVLSTNPYVQAQFVSGAAQAAAPDVLIYGDAPPDNPPANALCFLRGSRAKAAPVRVTGWNAQHPVTRWVRSRDVSISNPAALPLQPGDVVLARAGDASAAPLIAAREFDGRRLLLVGFDPRESNFPMEPAFPLFMASALEWLARAPEDQATALSAGVVQVAGPVTAVKAPSDAELAFAQDGANVRWLAPQTGTYTVSTPDGPRPLPVNTPPLPSLRWEAAAAESAAVTPLPLAAAARHFWPWLVVLAIVALWAELWLFGWTGRWTAEPARESQPDAAAAAVARSSEAAA